jgi:hypothetical protein
MRRRDFVKGIVAVPAAAKAALVQQSSPPEAAAGQAPTQPSPPAAAVGSAPAPPPDTFRRQSLGFKAPPVTAVVPDAFAETEAGFLNPQQLAALRKLCDILMPPLRGYPGALQAGAPEFLDFLIGVSPVERQQMYQSGLDRLNADAKKKFGIPFSEVNPDQADQLIRPCLAAWMNDHPPTEPFSRFINLAHHDIRTATLNSQAWSIAATSSGERAPEVGLYWSPIDPDLQRNV